MHYGDILTMRGGHKIIEDTSPHNTYRFYGFIPHEDTVFTSLYMGDEDVSPGAVTYKAGIYYGAPSKVDNGQYTRFQLASGSIVLVLSQYSDPNT
jgi:hypothetical protein